ncbi:bifunctional DNA-formamidopyrimidine glycosylase/DNA-(apurinic or apyrimidinic site) lyase [Rhodopirellula sp. MGV]|uniref:bifunctional DNA-formamidopyrimidine glycosylase/DNA-(apurinic or apyrimidinic site) lyase n=1 Tax=Rhodopirellula sp. MGV TaxID=2023130 RepID=UPI000B965F1A|nr:bifunctional DNA-formamidopyrimidine glycosylase/DNA-(apurinic or apyrimidinic site) lyase [Rhodopirellula sp. MGV]OYP29838.1 DNA-formamidopyrimidine glycosylase [Rhodopirellula sp. MGV]PNY33720.1 bifunctional DNA-formamidopyrimidine glycosylase/DNA-(apurinic or apyrimidinic site) lyase [Rhodopirellula baltica]
MPELPEVETMRRGVLPIVGSRIVAADCPPCERRPILMRPSIRTIARQLQGRRIERVERLGKRVILCIEGELSVVIEPRMTGLVLLADPPTREHLRFRLQLEPSGAAFDAPRELLFWDRRGLGTVRLFKGAELEQQVRSKLGQDALLIDAESLREKLNRSRRAIKVALLDQSVVAGIGNLYAAELLFLAGIDPRSRCDQLTKAQWKRIVMATRVVLEDAIAHEGSTLSDGTYRNALNQSGGYQNYHRVYDRADEICPRCGEDSIRRIVQAQRSTFFCGVCQKKRGLHPDVAEIEVSTSLE